MENPFKPDDKVQTKVKGAILDAVVRLVYNAEVQVRISDKTLLWRTVKTVWFPSVAPMVEPPQVENTSVQMTEPGADSNDGQSQAAAGTPLPDTSDTPATAPATAPTTAPTTTPAPTHAPSSDNASIEGPELPHVESMPTPPNVTACAGEAQPTVKHKKRRRK